MIGKVIGCIIIFVSGCLAGSDILVNLYGFHYSEKLVVLILGVLGSCMVMFDRER